MFEQTIETSATPHIAVAECLRNLTVQGSDAHQVIVRVDGEAKDLTLEREGETLTLSAYEDCRITCPSGSTLTVQAGRGNVMVKGVDGTIAISSVSGNLSLRDIGPAELEQVAGNLRARQVAGDLQGKIVQGNARVRHVKGRFSVKQVSGNLVAEGLQGGLAAEQVHGSVRLGPPFVPGTTYRLNASGNMKAQLPTDANLSLTLRAIGGVHSRVPGLALEAVGGEMRGVLGDGEASLEAQVSGMISLRGVDSAGVPPEESEVDLHFIGDLEEMGSVIETRVADALADVEARLEESLGRVDSERLRLRVEHAAEKGLRAAERAAEQLRQGAEREAQRARMRAERAERRWSRASGRKSRPRPEAATEEAQLRVLHMVEDGKITPEQAAELLAALGR